jgi:hypothetical protein
LRLQAQLGVSGASLLLVSHTKWFFIPWKFL